MAGIVRAAPLDATTRHVADLVGWLVGSPGRPWLPRFTLSWFVRRCLFRKSGQVARTPQPRYPPSKVHMACSVRHGNRSVPGAQSPPTRVRQPDNPTPLPQEIARSIRLVSRTHPRPSPGARPPTAIPMPTTVTASVCTSASTVLVKVPPPSSPSISMRVTAHAAANLAGRPKCRRGAAEALRLVVCRSPLHRVAVQGRIRGCLTLCSCRCPRLGPLSRSFKGPQSPLNADACLGRHHGPFRNIKNSNFPERAVARHAGTGDRLRPATLIKRNGFGFRRLPHRRPLALITSER